MVVAKFNRTLSYKNMEKLILLFTLLFFSSIAAANYNVYNKTDYETPKALDEKILFVVDYSSSMNEYLEGRTKYELVQETMSELLPKIPKEKWVGLRIYGHRSGITAYDACKASSLVVPVIPAGTKRVEKELAKHEPRGMTPITYSLKKAISSDMNFPENKRIILLTDGGENCDESPCKWAIDLIQQRKDINIDVIAFNVSEDEDLDQLRCTASVTSGKFYNPQTSAELIKSLENSLNITKEVEAQIVPKN